MRKDYWKCQSSWNNIQLSKINLEDVEKKKMML